MKIKILYFAIITTLLFVSCQDYLDVKSESKIDTEFVFQSVDEADKVVLGAYELMKNSSGVHSNSLWYDVICCASDIEVGCELPTSLGRYNNENLYNQTIQLSAMCVSSWNGIYSTINRCNTIIEAFENNESFINASKTTPSAITHLYGEVVALRATMYYELTRWWGDVIYFTKPITGKEDYEDATVMNRDSIQEAEIENLKAVEPMMYHLNAGDVHTTAERMTKEYVQGLIARMALIRGGFSLRPAEYSGDGEVIQSHSTWGKMVRRSDWKSYYSVAKDYLEKVVYDGNATLVTSDPRTPAEEYSNPFQYFFQQGMNYEISQESIYEVSIKAGSSTERTYAFGRPSDGGNTGYPPKAYDHLRFYPTYYYGMFNPKDMRRDVTVCTTALGGVANEKMISFKKGNKSNGGLGLNKWDYNRLEDKTYATVVRKSGVNAPYMRLGDMVLLLAETYAVLGEEGKARTELLRIRERAFNPNDSEYTALTSDYVGGLSGEALIEAIQKERALELGGEGQRRFDLVRWGIYGEKVYQLENDMDELVNALEASGKYEFDNGNVISTYIYTKDVKLEDSGLSDILTTSCYVTEDDPLYPLLYPEWRGTYTGWDAASGTTLLNSMVAIQGMFEPIDEAKAAALEADGYSRTDWGINLISESWKSGPNGIFGGYLPADYEANYPPRYILGIPATTIAYSGGNIANSYGFPNE